MIRRPTVLVLGAGASKPYGFPLGVELVDTVWGQILGSDLVTRLENLMSAPPGIAATFARALRASRAHSIDAFIETNRTPGFREVGKAAIADVLLRCETQDALDGVSPDADWYRYLLNVLTQRDVDTFRSQARKFAIITFNFDRSFEWALFSMLQDRFGLTATQARTLAMEVDIHHVHGVLGDPDWLLPGPDSNPFGCANRVALETAVRRAVTKINIVDEDIPKSVVEDLLVPLTNADFVYFLGFGFEERNILRLNLPDCLKNTAVVRATCLGKTTLEMTSARGRLKGPHLYHDDDARTFLRERAESLFDD